MDYRLYVLDSTRRIRSSSEFEVASDEEACQRAEAAAKTQPVELWQGKRRIGAFGKSIEPAAMTADPLAQAGE
jgi:hypothetical protein